MPGEIVSTKLLSCNYREGRVLEDISFQVVRGDYVGIVGPNGSGKSTLVKALLGLVAISKGSASLFGTPLSNFRDWHKVGYLPQSLHLVNPVFPATVHETVGLGLTDSVASVACAPLLTTSMSEMVCIALLLPAPTGPMNKMLHCMPGVLVSARQALPEFGNKRCRRQ